ncbi:MAG: hypothetical protein KatS3mg053_0933 [Candidatus Roseilinea sp.]|jgi:predicted nucleic acid-binding protein|nr:MAG: hypothetical protein KatS3mg053_0933 [Candidatus Roseilinea sp.]
MAKPALKVFLDTSALFAGIWSASGGAHAILQLGEAQLLSLVVSSQVLAEIEEVVREKLPDLLDELLLILDACIARVVKRPSARALAQARRFVSYEADARILAAAMTARAAYFVTLDRKHFLRNDALCEVMSFPIGTPGDFLQWYRDQQIAES